MYDKIKAIKIVRERVGISLRDAKALVEELEEHLQNSTELNTARAWGAHMRDERDCARTDLVMLIRLVGYFVKHPAAFDDWVAERGMARDENNAIH